MEEVRSLIDQVIMEHQQIISSTQISTRKANDVAILLKLQGPAEDFVSAGTNELRRKLRNLRRALKKVEQLLQGHFDREETLISKAFGKHRTVTFASALSVLLDDHEQLRKRITRSREWADELVTGTLSSEAWETKAYVMRSYLTHTLKLLKAHAETEEGLLKALRKELSKQ